MAKINIIKQKQNGKTYTGYYIRIPKKLAQDQNWNKGDEFAFIQKKDGTITLQPLNEKIQPVQ